VGDAWGLRSRFAIDVLLVETKQHFTSLLTNSSHCDIHHDILCIYSQVQVECDHQKTTMYSQRPNPPSLKRSYSGESHSSYASANTSTSRASSKLLFGEIPLTPATTVDGRCKTPLAQCAANDIDITKRRAPMVQYATWSFPQAQSSCAFG
jgi:hypothetical protein